MSGINTRLANPADLANINAINLAIRLDQDSPYQCPDLAPFDFDLEDRRVFVALREGRVMGYANVHAEPSFAEAADAEFELYVAEAERQSGAGQALLNTLCAFLVAESATVCRLLAKVHKDAPRSRHYFEHRHFSVVDTDPQGITLARTLPRL